MYRFLLLPACRISIAASTSASTAVAVCRLVAFDPRTERFWIRALTEHQG